MCGEFMAIAGIAAGAASTGVQMKQEEAAQAAQQQQLQLKMAQEKSQAAQQANARATKLQSVLSSQRAEAAASGMAQSSGTLTSLSTTSYMNFAEDNKIASLNLSANEASINEEIDASQQRLHDQIFGNFFDAVGDVANKVKLKSGNGMYSPEQKDQDAETLGPETYSRNGNSFDEYLSSINPDRGY